MRISFISVITELPSRGGAPSSYFAAGSTRRFWCKLLKGPVSCDNCRDDGTDLGTRSVQGRHFASREAENAINDRIIYLNSPKFYRDTTVQVSHVFHVLVPIRNQVSSIAQELERP